jgi:peptidoglycan/LPS O-acetylase OafA/YrhL
MDASASGRGLPHSVAVGLAYFGMSLFFVLSGFVICYNYENKVLSPYGRWQFFGARFARLFPMYAFVVIVYALPILDHSTPLVVVTHATMTQSWFNTEEAYFGATWSISTEWFFYFAFAYLISSPRLQAFAGWKPFAAFSAASVLALAILFILKPQIEWFFSRPLHPLFLHGGASNTIWTWLTYYSPMVRILEFMLGVIAARTYSALRPNVPSWAASLHSVGAPYSSLSGSNFSRTHSLATFCQTLRSPRLSLSSCSMRLKTGRSLLYSYQARSWYGRARSAIRFTFYRRPVATLRYSLCSIQLWIFC